MMKQTYKELVNIARAEHVPYSKTKKASLVDRIQHYRDTVGTLFRENKRNLKAMAKDYGLRRYSQLKKVTLIDPILYHRRVVKPRWENLTRNEIRRQAIHEGLDVIAARKNRMIHNLGRRLVRRNGMKEIVEDIANGKFKSGRVESAFRGNYICFRSKVVEEGRPLLTIEEYLEKAG